MPAPAAVAPPSVAWDARCMVAAVHSRSECPSCGAGLVFLVGDPAVGYEDIVPSDSELPTLIEHSELRCRFHLFLTPGPNNHLLPGNADWMTKEPIDTGDAHLRYQRWVRTDDGME